MNAETPDEHTQKQVGEPTVEIVLPSVLPKIAGYEVVREIDRGGMGIVYEARHLELNRTVAFKMLPRTATPDKVASEKFLAEGRVVAAIHHPNVVMVFDFGSTNQSPYLIMEYLSGGSLANRLKAHGPMPPRDAADLVRKIAAGVAAAHAQHVIHRDLKPANVLFDEFGEPKVVDFGLAKRVLPDTTVTQAVQGTPQYMSPEQTRADGTPIDARTDVWALGIILYECLTGLRPFVGPDAYSTIRKIIDEAPAAPRTMIPDRPIPRKLEIICLKCLEKKPANRYPDAAAMAEDLERFLAGEPIRGRITRAVPWRSLAVAAAVAAVVALSVGIVWFSKPAPTAEVHDAIRQAEVQRMIDAMLRIPPRPDATPPHPFTTVDKLDPADLSAFQYVEDERIIDMRGWKALPPELRAVLNPATGCSVISRDRNRIVKIAPQKFLTLESRTTGTQLVQRALTPHPELASVKFSLTPGFVGQQTMKVYQLSMDVSDQPINHEFETRTQTTYWSSLQDPADRWYGAIGKEGTLKTTMILLFPPDHPFTSFRLRVAPTRQADPEPYTGPRVVFEDPAKLWLYWEIPSPKAKHVFRVDWDW